MFEADIIAPLNYFGMYYRSLQSNLVDAERMLEVIYPQRRNYAYR